MFYRSIILFLLVALLTPAAFAAVTFETEPTEFANISIIAGDKVKELLTDAAAEKLSTDAMLVVDFKDYDKGFQFNTKQAAMDVDVVEFSLNPKSRRFKSKLSFSAEGFSQIVDLAGSYEERVSIPVLNVRYPHDVVITADAIDYLEIAKNKLKQDTVTDAEEMIGKTLKRDMPEMQPVRKRDLIRLQMVSRSATLNLVYKTPFMTLQTTGVAMDGGALGDTIRVRNSTSNKIVQAVIESEGQAVVSSGNM